MRFYLDESVSFACVESLQALGHEVVHAFSEGLSGVHDEAILEAAWDQGRVLVTRDYHFTNPIRFPTEGKPGIVYLRKGNLTAAQEAELLSRFVQQFDLSRIDGHLLTLSPHQQTLR